MFKFYWICCCIVVFFKSCNILGVQAKSCEKITCSQVFDPVCGAVQVPGRAGTRVIETFHNICHLTRIKCFLHPTLAVRRMPDSKCHINRKETALTRRLIDHSITGANQACNHSCPTYCVDTYDPQCMSISLADENYPSTASLKPMINHCHIDLFSCAQGINVTVVPFSNCYYGQPMFALQVAAFKALNLLETGSNEASPMSTKKSSRRSNDDDLIRIARRFNVQDRRRNIAKVLETLGVSTFD